VSKKIDDLMARGKPGVSAEIKQLQQIIERQAETIDRIRAAGRKRAPKVSGRRKGQKSFVRLFFGDVHGEHKDDAALAAFFEDVSILKPREVVCIGDGIDCGGFLSQHKTLGVVAELDVTYEEDVAAGNMVLDEVQRRAEPDSFDYIEGNHENRVNRWICDQVLGNGRNAEYLRRLLGPASVLGMEKRGIRYVERHKYYDGLSVSGTIKVDPYAVAQHGEAFCGKYSAFRHMDRTGESIFFGHTHRLSTTYAEKLGGPIVAVNTGCLCKLRPLYALTKTTDWMHGYAVQICDDRGFLAFTVPIINGVSYLQPLAKLLKV
jgi:predicted phosphodiesterase